MGPNKSQIILSLAFSSKIPMLKLMAQSLAKVLVHVVFSTKERRPFLRDQSSFTTSATADVRPRAANPWTSDFAWQSGYGIFSVGFSQLEDVRRYIAGQAEHHRKHTFKDEFRLLLKRYEITYDEQYVWA